MSNLTNVKKFRIICNFQVLPLCNSLPVCESFEQNGYYFPLMSHEWAEGICIPFLYTIYTSALTSDSSYQIPFNLSLISKLLCEMPAKHLG